MRGIRGFLESMGSRERSDEVPGEETVGLLWYREEKI